MRGRSGLGLAVLLTTLGASPALAKGMSPAVVAHIEVSYPGEVQIDRRHNRIYVADAEAGVVTVVDSSSNKVVSTIRVPPSEGGGLALNTGRSRLYVTGVRPAGPHTPRHGVVWVIDTATNRIVGAIGVPHEPFSVAVNPKTQRIYVTQWRRSVSVIDATTGSVMHTFRFDVSEGAPEDVAVNQATNRAYVATEWGALYVINGSTNKVLAVKRIPSGEQRLAVDVSRNLLVGTAPDGERVWVIDGATDRRLGFVRVGQIPQDVSVDPLHGLILVSTLHGFSSKSASRLVFVNPRTLSVVASVDVGEDATGVAVDSQTYRAYASDGLGGSLVVASLDGTPPQIAFSTADGSVLKPGDEVSGTARDDYSGVRTVTVSFEGPGGLDSKEATVRCSDGTRLSCTWTAPLPDAPGPYRVAAVAIDRAGTLESNDEAILVVRSA